jgi:hypothetical protein
VYRSETWAMTDGFEKNENTRGENIKKDVCTSDRARYMENKNKSGILGAI